MKFKTVFVSICFLFLLPANLFPQRPMVPPPPELRTNDDNRNASAFYKVGDVSGDIGEAKAIYLAKPEYPREAVEAGAEGKVKVEIVIDENGSVISAQAVSGNPLLYQTAQDAALRAKFSVPKVTGQGVRVSGHLNFNFSIETPNWFKVGYDLAVIEKVPTLGYFQIPLLKKRFQADWKTEIEWLDELGEIRREEKEAIAQMPDDKPPVINTSTPNSASQTMVIRLKIPPQNPQKFVLSQNLLSSLQKRLAADELSLWQFNLGPALVKFQELYRNPKTQRDSIEILKTALRNAPANAPAEFTDGLKTLIDAFTAKSSMAFRDQLARTIGILQRSK